MNMDEIINLVRGKVAPGGKIAITTYPDKESFAALRNPDGLEFADFQDFQKKLVNLLKALDYDVEEVELSVEEYKNWLGDELNTTTKRAAFAALKMEGKTCPIK